MKQIILGGFRDLLNISTTEYNSVMGGAVWNATEAARTQVISTPGTLRKLRIKLSAAPGAGDSFIFTLRYAASLGAMADSTLTVTVSGASDTSGADITHDVAVAAGGKVSLQCDPTGTPTAVYATWTMEFEGDNANESLLLACKYPTNANTIYLEVVSSRGEISPTDESVVRQVSPTAGVIKNLYVELSTDPGTSPDAYRITLRRGAAGGAMASTTLTCTITADAKTGSDVAHEVTVAAGDFLTLMIEPLNVPLVSVYAWVGMTFVADTDGESLILGGSSDDLNISTTEYIELCSDTTASGSIWTATENTRYQLAQVCVLKNLYVILSGAPGAGDSYVFTVRQNGGAPANGLVVTIAEAAVSGNDTTHTITVADDDYLDMENNPGGTPTAVDAYWGLVCYIAVIGPPISPLRMGRDNAFVRRTQFRKQVMLSR